MDEYNKQEVKDYLSPANDFLKETGTTFKTEFLRHGKHFHDDKDTRDIYLVTLQRGSRTYKFEFGQSLHNSGEYIGGQKTFCLNALKKHMFTAAEHKKLNHYDKRQGKIGKNPNFEQPTPYDVLSCLTKYDPESLENFCSEYGYDLDSRSAEKTYKAVKNEWQNVCMLWNDQEIEQLQEIQ